MVRRLILASIAASLLSGCDTTEVDPFFSSDRYFSIYGAFDMDFSVQYLRVIPIDTLVGAIDDSLDATVTTTDLTTGQKWVWRDSVLTFRDDSIGHVFSAPFRVQQGRTYRTEVVRSDGATTWAETTIPAHPRAEMGERSVLTSENTAFPLGSQKVFWRGLTEEPHRVDVFYRFRQTHVEPFIDFKVEYDTESSLEDTSEGWEITVNYSADRGYLYDNFVQNNPWRLAGVLMRVLVVSDDWAPPGGVWDLEVLAQPGTFSNVHNGFGFVGSSGRFSVEWIP